MKTPVYDFAKNYAKENPLRLHMPGHKGKSVLGIEPFDLTEVSGADDLYASSGIIEESRLNACSIYGAETYFVTEGSSQSIKAMLYLASKGNHGKKILAGRNAHKSFISGVALLGLSVEWLYSEKDEGYLSCTLSESQVERAILEHDPFAVYITSPDYLGNQTDIKAISKACKKHGVLLLVDNAHGAYLKFLSPSSHPIDLGADMCCDSAHKTLNALTGAGYLHINNNLQINKQNVHFALSLFGSTSPSYLTLISLDLLNAQLDGEYKKNINEFIKTVDKAKVRLSENGYTLIGSEKLKITINAKKYGYTGIELNKILESKGIISEFCDSDYLVFMLTPQIAKDDVDKLINALVSIDKKPEIICCAPKLNKPQKAMEIRSAVLQSSVVLPVELCENRVLSETSVSCPPAVPIVVSGEVIDKKTIECLKYYGVKKCAVIE